MQGRDSCMGTTAEQGCSDHGAPQQASRDATAIAPSYGRCRCRRTPGNERRRAGAHAGQGDRGGSPVHGARCRSNIMYTSATLCREHATPARVHRVRGEVRSSRAGRCERRPTSPTVPSPARLHRTRPPVRASEDVAPGSGMRRTQQRPHTIPGQGHAASRPQNCAQSRPPSVVLGAVHGELPARSRVQHRGEAVRENKAYEEPAGAVQPCRAQRRACAADDREIDPDQLQVRKGNEHGAC